MNFLSSNDHFLIFVNRKFCDHVRKKRRAIFHSKKAKKLQKLTYDNLTPQLKTVNLLNREEGMMPSEIADQLCISVHTG